MKPETAKTLNWLTGFLLFAGFLVMSPTASFFAGLLAAFTAAFPALFGTKRPRVVAVLLLVCSLSFAAGMYSDYVTDNDRYLRRARTPG